MRSQGAESTSRSLEHILISVGGKLAWPISAEVKEVNWHWQDQTKMADSLSSKVQTKCNSSKEKQVILILRAWVHHIQDTILCIWVKQDWRVNYWIDLAWTSGQVPCRGWQAPCGMWTRYDHSESDYRLSQPGFAKPHMAATLTRGGQRIFNVCNDLSVCCSHEG